MPSAVLIIPVALRDAANQVEQEMGRGPNNYTIPLSDDDGETITHYGLRGDYDTQFIRQIKGIDPLPPEIADAAQPVLDALIYDFSPDPTVEYGEDETPPPALTNRPHFDAVIGEHGLQEMPRGS